MFSVDSMQRQGTRSWLMLWLGCMGLLLVMACGPSFPGTFTLVSGAGDTQPASLLLRNGDVLYLIDDQKKLQVYDISDPKSPTKAKQVDIPAFSSYYGMAIFGNRLAILGTDGEIAILSIADDKDPQTPWGRNDSVKLPFPAGPFVINQPAGAMYITPGNGKALARIDLGVLNVPVVPEAAAVAAGITTYDGDGGGGIALVLDETQSNTPVRLYVATKNGKVGVWLPSEVEQGTATGPASSFDHALGDRIKRLFFIGEANTNTLVAVASPAEGAPDLQTFSLGRNFTTAGEPTANGTATVNGLHAYDRDSKTAFTLGLEVWDLSEGFLSPTQVAASVLRNFQVRDLTFVGKVVLTAESEGFRVHEYVAAP